MNIEDLDDMADATGIESFDDEQVMNALLGENDEPVQVAGGTETQQTQQEQEPTQDDRVAQLEHELAIANGKVQNYEKEFNDIGIEIPRTEAEMLDKLKSGQMTAEELQEVEDALEDLSLATSPGVAAMVRGQLENIKQQERQRIQQEIDGQMSSRLKDWESKAGEEWELALQFDNYLRGKPEWSDKPLNERFAEVERRVAGAMGINPQPLPTATTDEQGNISLSNDMTMEQADALFSQFLD